MQLSLFKDDHDEASKRLSLPLVVVPDTTWRLEIRALWSNTAQRGIVALELTDDDSRELIEWQLLPGTHSLKQLAQQIDELRLAGVNTLAQLDEPF